MIHFAGEILLFMFFTALLWFAVGWWVSSIDRAKRMEVREAEWNHHLNTLRRDRDAFRDESEKAHGKIRVLENRRADGKSPPQETSMGESERERYRKVAMTLQENLDAAKRQINGFAIQVDTLRQQSIEREDILEQLKKKLTDTSRTLHDREMRLEQLNQENAPSGDSAVDQSQQFATTITGQHRSAAEHARELAHLRAEHRSSLEATAADRTRLEVMLRENEQTLATVREQLAATQQQLQKTKKPHAGDHLGNIEQTGVQPQARGTADTNAIDETGDLRRTIKDQEQVIKTLRNALEENQQRNARPDPALTQQLRQRDEEIDALRLAVERSKYEVEQARNERQTQMGLTIDRQEHALAKSKQRDEQREQEHAQELAELRDAMGAQEQIIAQLRREMAGAKPMPPRRKPVAEKMGLSGDLFAGSITSTSAGTPDVRASNDPVGLSHESTPKEAPVTLYDEAPERFDNLQRINGIGPKFERALNDAGIYCFDQLAALADHDIAWLADVIRSFPERIERGDWLNQARALVRPG